MDRFSASDPQVVRRRPVTDEDQALVLALNQAEVELLAPMNDARFAKLRGLAHLFDVIEVHGQFAGFVITFAPEADYDSENFVWFRENLDSGFYYLDRIVLTAAVRRQGVGKAVYDDLEAIATTYGQLALEVNLIPENPGSLAFHAGRGYVEVGRLGDEEHLVTLMTKTLT